MLLNPSLRLGVIVSKSRLPRISKFSKIVSCATNRSRNLSTNPRSQFNLVPDKKMSSNHPADIYVALSPSTGKLISANAKSSSVLSSAASNEVERLWQNSRVGQEKAGQIRVFFGVGDGNQAVVAVSTGKQQSKEENTLKEVSRKSAALAVQTLKSATTGVSSKNILIDPLFSPHSSAVGATLASFAWNLKTTKDAKALLDPIKIELLGTEAEGTLEGEKGSLNWSTGEIYGKAQNLARELMELPANICTPTYFTERAKTEFQGLDNTEVIVRDLEWAKEKKMGSFISVSRGSSEPLKFLELHYKGAANKEEAPIAFVGKGITFDSGGISLKPGAGMKDMRADMGGAATTLAATWAIASLKLPINLVLCIPLTENMPGPSATKPGDVVTAGNGVTIEVDNTDAEGRLVLADALYYASSTFKPKTVIDVATLTGAMMIALGNQFTGVFTNSDTLWSELNDAAQSENDPVWRMPLHEGYMSQISGSGMDLINTGGKLAGSCTAAIFLKRFVDGLIIDGSDNEDQSDLIRWAHLDIAGVMDLAKGDGAYNLAGMTGRPVRALVEFARRQSIASKVK